MKHLNGKDHDHQPKGYDIAVQMLGILVLTVMRRRRSKTTSCLIVHGCWISTAQSGRP
jgi:hypothetical protein